MSTSINGKGGSAAISPLLPIFTALMKYKPRYKFWQVLVGIICLGIFAAIMHSITNESSSAEEVVKEKPEVDKWRSHVIRPLGMFFYIVMFFYFTLNYFYHLIAQRKTLLSFLLALFIIYCVSALYYTLLYNFYPAPLQDDYPSWIYMIGVMATNMIPMLILSFLFAFATYLWESQKQRRILEAQKLQLESQISQANFNFLKAQINPHFLHNTLNFLYAKSLPYSAELSEGILTLSDIMRYAIDQGNQKAGKAPLKDEIEHVNNVIKISQLRFSNTLNVSFKVTGVVNGKLIIPFVLITIVENAFKHGDLKSQQDPIDIALDVKGNQLYFYCRNKKKTGPKQLGTGIGLDNIRKRLDLAYGDNYKFIVREEPDYYTTELIIEQL